MQVLRVGGEYLEARQHHAATAFLLVAGSGAAGAAAVARGLHPLAGLLLAVTVAALAAKAYRRLGRVSKGIRGEAVVTELLSRLSDDYFLVNDVVVPGLGGNVDHVVVGPCGVVVIETKNFSGSVQSHWDAWFVNGRRCRSVSKQVNGAAAAVREWLTHAHPDLAESALRFVDSVVVFVNPTSRVRIDRAQTTVVRYSQLLDVVLAKARRKRVPAAVAARLAATLATLGDGPSAPRRVGAPAAALHPTARA
jgi:hypothetical protein